MAVDSSVEEFYWNQLIIAVLLPPPLQWQALLACSKMPWRPEYDDVIHDNNDDDYDDDQYCSTSHRNKGGQLKGREAKFGEGDIVEVLYDEDEEWYEATVLKKVEYQDDIRLVRS